MKIYRYCSNNYYYIILEIISFKPTRVRTPPTLQGSIFHFTNHNPPSGQRVKTGKQTLVNLTGQDFMRIMPHVPHDVRRKHLHVTIVL